MIKPSYKLFLLVFFILFTQIIITYGYTNAKKFSFRALFRNLTFGLGIYYFVITRKMVYFVIPFVLEIIVELLKYNGYQIEKYIATEYQYSDYWRDINVKNPIFSNFSEGLYDDYFGVDTRNHSEENVRKLDEWLKMQYYKSHESKSSSFIDLKGVEHKDIFEIKKIGDEHKFKTICKQCDVVSGMKILEIGFGEGDFMNYIRKHYGISPVGVSISSEQVNLVKSRGFIAHHMDMWDMTPEVLGTFDLIIQCGNMEYVRCSGESEDKYGDYFKIINHLLNDNGKHFMTCIHQRKDIMDNFDIDDYVKGYYLLSGNDGAYPRGKYALKKYTDINNLKLISQEERTNDYWLTGIFFMSLYQYTNENNMNLSISGILNSLVKTIAAPYYIHTYVCYSPNPYDNYSPPWNWQFIPKTRNGEYKSVVTMEYILVQKTVDNV